MGASQQTHLLAFEGAGLVAVGLGVKEAWQPEPHVQPLVPAENRRRGLGSALLTELSRWAADAGHDALLAFVELGDEESIGFATRRGFAEIGRELGVALDLEGELLTLDPPSGVEIVTWAERPELVGGIYEVYCEGSVDIPGEEASEIAPFEDWLAHDMSGSGDRPEWTFVAVAGEEVVGYSKWSLTTAQPHTAHHDLTAVKRSWRGRESPARSRARSSRGAKENRLHEGCHEQRGAKRADPAPEQRALRVPPRGRPDPDARPARRMKYMVMMFGDAGEMRETRSTEWIREMIAFMVDVDRDLRARGELVSAEGLADPGQATTVTFADGATIAAAGPFSEARASIAGYWILEVDEARAVEFAKHIVAFTHGPIEVRQVMDGPPEV